MRLAYNVSKGKRRTPKVEGRELILSHGLGEGDVAGFEVQFGFGGSAEDFGASVVEFAFHLATTTVARQLPIRFTQVRPMSINSSTPKMTATPMG